MLLTWNPAAAQSIPYNSTWRRAQVLPAGQSLFSFSSSYSRVDDRLSENGKAEGLGAQYAQAITWGELFEDQGLGKENNQDLRNYVKAQGLDLNSTAASTEFKVSQEVLNLSPKWAYGMTENWMVGFQLPIVYRRTKVSSQIEISDDYSRLASRAAPSHLDRLSSKSMSTRARQALARKLESYQYEPVQNDRKEWDLGDAEILSKLKILQREDIVLAFRQRIMLPTSSPQSPYRYVDTSVGDGQFDLGVDTLVDYWFARGWLMTASLGYTWQAPDQIRARSRSTRGSADTSTEIINLEVNRDLGDYWSTKVFAEHAFTPHWKILTGYSYQKKYSDRFESNMYGHSAQNSEQEFHMGHAGLNYRLDPLSQRMGLKNQFSTSIYFSTVLSGNNVPSTSLAGVDFQLLF